ncbi:AlpA family phage regulatory protein [Paracoccus sp. N5]|uniref:helix-turn-helix transcriptional regulator n=1 Tax=Paracoccus sp. N5 TaxID=1101189 RepID=UPI000362491C|nr:AlpA family phage regulatory protein [Paracoccus sp. N5]
MKGILAIAESVKGKTLINRKKLLAMIPLSDRTIYNMEQRGEFPHRIALTSRNVAWDLAEVEAWIEARKLSSELARRPGPMVVGDDPHGAGLQLARLRGVT